MAKSSGRLTIATCQFAVSGSIKSNSKQICHYMKKAANKADIIHFPECALSGYVGTDFANFNNFDWPQLQAASLEIAGLAKALKLWVILGSVHRLTSPNKPFNSLYLINSDGELVDRYDKRFCTIGDLRRHCAGDHFVTFDINGVRCSLLICFDLRFPEIYRKLYTDGVNCIFQSFYNARQTGPSIHTHIMRQTAQARAATNKMWLSLSNSSGNYSPYPSCFIGADGEIIDQLRQNLAGVMINTVDLSKKIYDPMARFRDMAIEGSFSNGPAITNDKRATNRKSF